MYIISQDAKKGIISLECDLVSYEPLLGKGLNIQHWLECFYKLCNSECSEIEILINSSGGNVNWGYSIIHAIKESNKPVNTNIVGFAYSIAGVISLMGTNRTINDFGSWMCHNAFIPNNSNPQGHEEKMVQIQNDSILNIISTRIGKGLEVIKGWMERTTFFSADECLNMGIVQKINKTEISNKKITNHIDVENCYIEWKKVHNFTNNNILKNQKIIDMDNLEFYKKVIEKTFEVLDISKMTTEDKLPIVVNDAISAMRDKIKNMEMENKMMKDKIANYELEKEGMEKQIANLKAKEDELIKDKVKSESDQEYEKEVSDAIKNGKILPTNITFIDKLKVDYGKIGIEGIKAVLNVLPILSKKDNNQNSKTGIQNVQNILINPTYL